MTIPVNLIHFYIGIPILSYLTLYGLVFSKNKHNTVTRYLSLGSGVFLLAALAYCIPVLFTQDARNLTYSTILGDALQFISLNYIWLLGGHLLLSQSKPAQKTLQICVFIITVLSIYVSIIQNLAEPTVLKVVDSTTLIVYAYTDLYNILHSIMFGALIVVGLSFLLQIKQATTVSQKYRIAAIVLAFLVNGVLFSVAPLIKLNTSSIPVVIIVSGSFIAMTALMILSQVTRAKISAQ